MTTAARPPTKRTRDDELYFTDNGRIACGKHCGMSAQFTLRDISGQRITKVTSKDAAEWLAGGWGTICCEDCGRTVKESP